MTEHIPADYAVLLKEIKTRITGARVRAALAVSRELLTHYWEIGELIDARQRDQGWGVGVIPQLAKDLVRELPSARGYSVDNLKRMVQFFRAYPALAQGDGSIPQKHDRLSDMRAIGAQPVPQLRTAANGPQPVAQPLTSALGTPSTTRRVETSVAAGARLALELPWGHNILILQKLRDPGERVWYLNACLGEGWSRDVLGLMIKSRAHERSGAAVTNFATTMPAPQSDLAQQIVKDPYVFDFLGLSAGFRERELEAGLLAHLERFLIELGVGFAFVGRQVRLTLEDDEFFVDLLFFHLKLRCFVVVELKTGPFKAEYAGKLNLYLNLVDDTLRHPSDAPSIGLILCQDKKRVLAEYALRGLDKPIGVSEYELTRALPTELASTLPTIEAIEAELGSIDDGTEEEA